MTLRFAFSTEQWRSPLRLIDSLLPAGPALDTRTVARASGWGKRFAQAGWLGHPEVAQPCTLPTPSARVASRCVPSPSRDTRLVVHSHPKGLRISGRVADVCAELDRLAQREAMRVTAVRH